MNIFVANLNSRIRKENLLSIFAEFGVVSAVKVIMDRETGRSKGYGFVEMPNEEEARRAINDLNGAEWEGKYITVKESEPRGESGASTSSTLSSHDSQATVLPALTEEDDVFVYENRSAEESLEESF